MSAKFKSDLIVAVFEFQIQEVIFLGRALNFFFWWVCSIDIEYNKSPGGPLVFKGGYHARVWPLKTDPKQGF